LKTWFDPFLGVLIGIMVSGLKHPIGSETIALSRIALKSVNAINALSRRSTSFRTSMDWQTFFTYSAEGNSKGLGLIAIRDCFLVQLEVLPHGREK